MARAPLLTMLAALALASCGKADNDAGPGGVSAGEAKALDEAAEMLEAEQSPAQAASGPPSAEPAKNK